MIASQFSALHVLWFVSLIFQKNFWLENLNSHLKIKMVKMYNTLNLVRLVLIRNHRVETLHCLEWSQLSWGPHKLEIKKQKEKKEKAFHLIEIAPRVS